MEQQPPPPTHPTNSEGEERAKAKTRFLIIFNLEEILNFPFPPRL